jgi:hypothetical protein
MDNGLQLDLMRLMDGRGTLGCYKGELYRCDQVIIRAEQRAASS